MSAKSGQSGAASRSRRRRILGAVVSLLLFGAAIWVLRSELHNHPLHEILAELKSFRPLKLFLSLAATILGYLALAGYDAVSLAALGRRLAFRRTAYAAFLGYAFANTLPLSVVTGAAVRYRLYQQWGIEKGDAARVITLNTVTYVVGLLASAGLAFALQPVEVPGFLRLPLHSARPLGFVCLAVVAAYLVWSSRKGGDLRIWKWELPRPTFRRALAQLGVSFADWVFSGLALYVLLPHRVPFHVFFAIYLLGQIAGLVAQVPAGLGVFEAVMLWGLTPALTTASVLIGLVAYRLVYFLLPLMIATAVWAVREGRRWLQKRAGQVRRASA
ncbi:MAG: lysylphosphatidylglycerol synthase domain-containing protein [Gemmatimonadales bacterium]